MAVMNDSVSDGNYKDVIPLHWDRKQERRGLGDLICKANHVAITVSDIGRSLWFYTDVLGLQQIRRPNFDRHGAWLTMGNIELHLILGNPHVPPGTDLIVGHISLETDDIQEVLRRLKEMEIPFETNVSVPKGDEKGIVTQFFLRDPDGYYIELCNCDILTDFCLGKGETDDLEGYEESGSHLLTSLSTLTKMMVLAEKAKKNIEVASSASYHDHEILKILNTYDELEYADVVVDDKKLKNLLKRTHIYGDLVQGETVESLRIILQKTNNDVPEAIRYVKAKHCGSQVFQPPTIYKNNEEAFKPEQISSPSMSRKHDHHDDGHVH